LAQNSALQENATGCGEYDVGTSLNTGFLYQCCTLVRWDNIIDAYIKVSWSVPGLKFKDEV
jgi:hypothetical protein